MALSADAGRRLEDLCRAAKPSMAKPSATMPSSSTTTH
jgi:hypothetical protein